MVNSSHYRTYYRQDCITFRKTSEPYGGLSNMAGGYPLLVNSIHILTSEALYQACRYPHLPDVQKLIIAQKSPMTAKMKSKPYRSQSRTDWDKVRVNIMRWCLRVKLVQHWEKFSQLLLSTGDKPIVEDSSKDNFWGAIPDNLEQLIGINVLGRLLMELREFLRHDPDSLKVVYPPTINDFLLLAQPINIIKLNQPYKKASEESESVTTFKLQLDSSFREDDEKSSTQANQVRQEKLEDRLDSPVNVTYPKDIQDTQDAFYYIFPYLERQLNIERKSQELAKLFNVRQTQMQDWLEQGVELGKFKKLSKPVRYISTTITHQDNLPLLELLTSE